MMTKAKTWCGSFDKISRDDVLQAGGKGASLGDMVQADLPIPPGFVIYASAYREMVEQCGIDARLKDILCDVNRSDPEQLDDVAKGIAEMFEEARIASDLREFVLENYRSLGDQVPVAVRSSATAEDLAGASFAGQQETYLNIVGDEELLDAIRRCWASLYTSRAIFYRCQKGFDDHQVSMAVVVQRMVSADKSGVIFTVDPIFRNHYQMVIEAVWGLGEGIVSGTITPDHYKIDRETYELTFEFVPEKELMYCRNGCSGVVQIQVPEEKRTCRILCMEELRQLVDLAMKVEGHFGAPQDVEWEIECNEIFLLQSRPITSL